MTSSRGHASHITVKLGIIGSYSALSPGRRQAIIWTNAGTLSIGPLGTDFSEIGIEIYTFSFKNAFENDFWEMTAILSRPQRVLTWTRCSTYRLVGVCSTPCLCYKQRKLRSSAWMTFCQGNHTPMYSPHEAPAIRQEVMYVVCTLLCIVISQRSIDTYIRH